MSDTITITIGGTKQADIIADIIEAVVDTNYFLPAMFTLVLQDNYDDKSKKFLYADDTKTFKIGAAVKIEVSTDRIPGSNGSDVKGTLFTGEITSLEPIFCDNGVAQFLVRGYDKAHRLTRGTKTRTFLQKKDSDIISTIAGEVGLSADCDTSSIMYEYLVQYNQTNWDFVQSRARLLGYRIYVDDTKLCFKKADIENTGQAAATMEWGKNLNTFEPRINSMGQLQKVTAYGWDPAKKEAITGVSTSTTSADFSKTGYTKKGSATSKEAFGAAEESLISMPLITADQAKTLAESRLIEAESSFIKAEGSCRVGDPRIKSGVMIDIQNVGTRFSGKYFVTESRHEWSGGQYSLTFNATGYTGSNLFGLLSEKYNENFANQDGVVPAVVTNNNDPDKLGRVKVKFPWWPKDNGNELESNWARIASSDAGPERGFVLIPEVNDEVLVAFEKGDVNFPYIIGTLWNGKDKLPKGTGEYIASGKVTQRVFKSRSGHLIILDDTQGKEQVIIKDKTEKNSIIIDSANKTMTFSCEGDLIFDAGGKVTITSKQDMAFTSKAKAAIKSTGEMSLASDQKASVKGGNSQVGLEMAGTTIKGIKVDIAADAQASVKGNAMVQIQGAIVKIN